jgi:hypothetical protein
MRYSISPRSQEGAMPCAPTYVLVFPQYRPRVEPVSANRNEACGGAGFVAISPTIQW